MISGDLSWDGGGATIVAALLAAAVVVAGYFVQQSISRQAQLAELFAEALRAVHDYVESPYVIGRRDGSHTARMAVTNRISDIQSRLAYFDAALEQYAPVAVTRAFRHLVATARVEAGAHMTAAWASRPTRRDRDVPIKDRLRMPATEAAMASVVATMTPGARFLRDVLPPLVIVNGAIPALLAWLLPAAGAVPRDVWLAIALVSTAGLIGAICLSARLLKLHRRPFAVTATLLFASGAAVLYWMMSFI